MERRAVRGEQREREKERKEKKKHNNDNNNHDDDGIVRKRTSSRGAQNRLHSDRVMDLTNDTFVVCQSK